MVALQHMNSQDPMLGWRYTSFLNVLPASPCEAVITTSNFKCVRLFGYVILSLVFSYDFLSSGTQIFSYHNCVHFHYFIFCVLVVLVVYLKDTIYLQICCRNYNTLYLSTPFEPSYNRNRHCVLNNVLSLDFFGLADGIQEYCCSLSLVHFSCYSIHFDAS